jgi:2,3-dihydroxybiphenyl 1,2-dioxygenase
MHALESAYVVLEVADLEANTDFLVSTIGVAPRPDTVDGARAFAVDDAVHRILLSEGARNDIAAYGVEATSLEAFSAVRESLQRLGYEPADDPELARARSVERLFTVVAPWGRPVEVVLGLARSSTPALPLMPGGFLTRDQGFGHVVIATTEFDSAHRFLTEGLGFAQSDWLETEIMEGVELEVKFYHCNARHHSFALARAPFELPTLIHHFMLETKDVNDVGAAFDRTWSTTLGIANGLGLHDNDRMFSFYVISPGGYQVEVGYGARTIEEPWTENRKYDRISLWGHQPLRLPA